VTLEQLIPAEYPSIRRLVEPLRYNLVVDSILDGNTPAWVYVDNPAHPRRAWLWNRQDAMHLVGHPRHTSFNRALAELIRDQVIPDARRRYIPQLSLHYAPEKWEQQIDVILEGLRPEKAMRRYYRFDQLRVDWRAGLPTGCQMHRMDMKLLTNSHLENLHEVIGWVHSFWSYPQTFVETGFGFCLLEGKSVASWCMSVYLSGQNVELGLATALAFRGRGYATLTAAACLERCQAHHMTPHWHCWEDNQPSIAVAEKVGFIQPVRYPVFKFAL
jgi:RimJ/RimL family protein N-acetyltransferase